MTGYKGLLLNRVSIITFNFAFRFIFFNLISFFAAIFILLEVSTMVRASDVPSPSPNGGDGHHNQNSIDAAVFAKSAMRGVISGITLQPFDLIKTNSQACLKNSSPIEVFKNIIRTDGYPGLFKGLSPSIGRSIIRDVFRFPMIMGMPQFYSDSLGTNNQYILQPLTGASIAVVESLALGPLERIKVYAMTKSANDHNTNISFKDSFKGMRYQVIASSVGWSSFLLSQYIYKEVFKSFKADADDTINDSKNNNPNNSPNNSPKLNSFDLSLIGGMSGLTTALCFMPLDACKTLVQKAGPEKDVGLFGLLAKIIRSKGIKGLYSGWQMTVSSLVMNSVINVNFINWLRDGE